MRKFSLLALASLTVAVPFPSMASGELVTLRNVSSKFVVDVVGALTNEGQPAILFGANGNKNQLFEMRIVKDPGVSSHTDQLGVRLIAQHSLKCLTVAGGSGSDFAPVIQIGCHAGDLSAEGDAQVWSLDPIGGPPAQCPPLGCLPTGFKIVNFRTGKCLDARNANFPTPPPLNAPLQQFTCAKDTSDPKWVNQTFDFNPSGQSPVLH